MISDCVNVDDHRGNEDHSTHRFSDFRGCEICSRSWAWNINELNLNVFSQDINLPVVCLTKTFYFTNGNKVLFIFLARTYTQHNYCIKVEPGKSGVSTVQTRAVND